MVSKFSFIHYNLNKIVCCLAGQNAVRVLWEFYTFFALVPGGSDGPSGVLVCSENYLTYKNFGDQQDLRMPIPRRKVLRNFLLLLKLLYFIKINIHVIVYVI